MYKQSNNKRKKVHNNIMDSFTINNQTFNIILTNHATQRFHQRGLDKFQIIGSILALGEKTILHYQNSNKDLMVIDKINNFSIVASINGNDIVIITLIDKSDIFIKEGTTAINLY